MVGGVPPVGPGYVRGVGDQGNPGAQKYAQKIVDEAQEIAKIQEEIADRKIDPQVGASQIRILTYKMMENISILQQMKSGLPRDAKVTLDALTEKVENLLRSGPDRISPADLREVKNLAEALVQELKK